MSAAKNMSAAFQVAAAMPGRVILLALPVAAATALALATLAIDQGLSAKAEQAARSFGQDVISIRPGARVIAGQSGTATSLSAEDVDALLERLRGYKAIEGTRREDNVPTSAGSKSGRYKLFGVRPPWADVRQFGADRGDFLDDDDVQSSARVCLLGQTPTRELFGDQDPIGQEVTINQVPFRVKGVLVTKGSSPAEGDRDARIVIPVTTFYDRLYKRVHLDQIVVQARDSEQATLAKLEGDIQSILRTERKLKEGEKNDFTIRLPSTIAEQSRGVSRNVFYLLLGLAGVCGLAAVFLIVLVYGQAVRSRRGEIGIRRAMGATPGDILIQFWAEGLVTSVIGGLVGVLLGIGGAYGLAASRGLEFGFGPLVVVAPLAIVVFASLAGLIPARSAAGLDPAEALRPQV
ncbi:MAG: ABC transporter permease [Planctomycetota bacterium]|nr:ABC transporter permease [Planctomycetota bacterium]